MEVAELAPQITESESAVIAAAQASEAVAELLRFSREGPGWPSVFGDVEVLEKLAEALLLAGRIHLDSLDPKIGDYEYRDEIGQLNAACARFIDGWAG